MEEPAENPSLEEEGAPDPRLGGILDGRYRIVGKLGEGGMGLVYEANHVFLKTRVALKVLRASSADKEAIERLKREAQSASAIGNPHIVDVRDFGQLSDGATYVVMEFIEGVDLLTEIRKDRLTTSRARNIAVQIAEALAAAHEQGIVHRDLKPENILLTTRNGQPDYVKLVDFGIARIQGATKLTAAGKVVGTPEYMAPEQCAGIDVDHRADIYALGVLLYEMLTGTLPFADDDLVQLLRKQIKEAPLPPSRVAPDADIPLELEGIVLRCLAKRPSQRFQSMTELREALETLTVAPAPKLDESEPDPFGNLKDLGNQPTQWAMESVPGVPAGHPTPEAQPATSAPRRGIVLALAAVAVAAVALVVVLALRTETAPTPPVSARPPVETERAVEAPPEPAPTEPAPAEPAPRAARVAAAAPTQITIESEPPGARAFQDGALIGETPLSLLRPAEGERLVLTLSHRGYQDTEIAIGALSAEHLTVTLAAARRHVGSTAAAAEPEPATTTPATSEPPATTRPAAGNHRPGFMNPWE
ncbi:MAG: serine/threonine protein kinase [Sandaracinaceae bacterium]|nr:serine/threonine protein kinase [Sandaracinaceae bacterium]